LQAAPINAQRILGETSVERRGSVIGSGVCAFGESTTHARAVIGVAVFNSRPTAAIRIISGQEKLA